MKDMTIFHLQTLMPKLNGVIHVGGLADKQCSCYQLYLSLNNTLAKMDNCYTVECQTKKLLHLTAYEH
jgi:hypothetical protein